MDFTGKKLLILAGSGIHSKVVRAARELEKEAYETIMRKNLKVLEEALQAGGK